MPNNLSKALLFSTFFLLTSFANASNVPSYNDALQKFFSDSANKGKSPFTPEEHKLMENSAKALAKQLPNPGLKVGQHAPDFNLPNAMGKPVSLSSMLEQGPVVMVFYRGAWCPFCNLHLHALNKALPEFKKYNAQLVTITPQTPDKSAEQLVKDNFPFEVLSDLDSKVMKAYKMHFELSPEIISLYKKHGLDVEAFNGKGRTELPIPGTFVIDQKGVIRAVHAETDYKQRMEPAAILKALKDINVK